MKKFPIALVNCLLLLLGCLGVLLCLVTAFDFAVAVRPLCLQTAVLCLVYGLVWSMPRHAPLVAAPLTTALFLLGWSQRIALVKGFLLCANTVLGWYGMFYPVFTQLPAPEFSSTAESAADCAILFFFLAALLALCLGWAFIRQRSLILTLPWTLLPLSICLLITDTVPDAIPLLLLLSFWAVLGLSRLGRAVSAGGGARQAAIVLPLTLALLAALYCIVPPSGYTRPAWPDALQSWIREQLLDLGNGVTVVVAPTGWADYGGVDAAGSVELSSLGPVSFSGQTLLRVTASSSGHLYLRGISYGDYTGSAWEPDGGSAPTVSLNMTGRTALTLSGSESLSNAVIEDVGAGSDVEFLPYYYLNDAPATPIPSDSMLLKSTDVYTPNYMNDIPDTETDGPFDDASYRAYVEETFLQLPDDTAETLRTLAAAAGIDSSASRAEVAEAVASYVRRAGTYDLNAPATPAGQDFVLYFLQTSHRGYCVHFASAATAMLRALGVPARYVTGFSTEVSAGTAVDVPDSAAHAWVEVYYNGTGWVPLEVTPGAYGTTIDPEDSATASPSSAPSASSHSSVSSAPSAAVLPSPSAAVSPAPSTGTHGGNGNNDAQRFRLPVWLVIPLLLAVLWLTVILRRRFVLARRERSLQTGEPNLRAIRCYRYLQQLRRYGGVVPGELTALAAKAAFSQHTLTDEEAESLCSFARAESSRVFGALSLPGRLLFRYGSCLG